MANSGLDEVCEGGIEVGVGLLGEDPFDGFSVVVGVLEGDVEVDGVGEVLAC